MMHQLHPMILTDLGLKATLEDMANHWSERNPQLALSIECCTRADALDQKISIQLFRVIQECLTNTVRHAQAKQVKVTLTTQADSLQLRVADDGIGCDIKRVCSGFGLRGMQERIKSLGGELSIHSQPGQGMTITAKIPL